MPEGELHSEPENPRIGVFVCGCGGQISQSLDLDALAQHACSLTGVCYSTHDAYPCSLDGQEKLCNAIQDQHLDRVLIAGCAPRLVEKLFQKAVQPLKIDPGHVAQIRAGDQGQRVQASLVHNGVECLYAGMNHPSAAPIYKNLTRPDRLGALLAAPRRRLCQTIQTHCALRA